MEDGIDGTEENDVDMRSVWRRSPISMFVATVGGLGHLPLAPGTWGTIAALPVLAVGTDYSPTVRLAVLIGTVAVAIPSATRAGRAMRAPDSDRIVVDEFVGMLATLVWFPDLTWMELVVGFALFRLFDVLKPPGAHWLHARRHDGTGVVGDDLVAALWAALLFALLHWSFP